jgi:hypothetical protein
MKLSFPPPRPHALHPRRLLRVEVIPGDESETVVRLDKQARDGAVYDCVQAIDGTRACDCPSFVYGTSGGCKHLRAVAEAGLFPASTRSPPCSTTWSRWATGR